MQIKNQLEIGTLRMECRIQTKIILVLLQSMTQLTEGDGERMSNSKKLKITRLHTVGLVIKVTLHKHFTTGCFSQGYRLTILKPHVY